MAANPVFAVTPRLASATLSVADTSYTAPANVATLLTGAATGTRVAEIVVQATATVSAATMVRIFLFDSVASAYYLYDEVAIAAATGSQSVRQTRVSTLYNNLILPNSNWSVRVTTHSANTFTVTAHAADL